MGKLNTKWTPGENFTPGNVPVNPPYVPPPDQSVTVIKGNPTTILDPFGTGNFTVSVSNKPPTSTTTLPPTITNISNPPPLILDLANQFNNPINNPNPFTLTPSPPPIVTPPPIITPPKPPKPPKPVTDPVTHVKRDHTPPDINDKWLDLYTNLIDSGKTDAEATESVNNTLKDYLDQLSSQALASSAPEPYIQEAMPELSEIQLLAIETNCNMLWKLAHLPIPQIIRILKSVRDRLRIQQDYERGNNALQFRKNKNYQGTQRSRRKSKIRKQRKTSQW